MMMMMMRRHFGNTPTPAMPMKAGTVLKPLGILKGQDPPVVLERSEYPAWVDTLAAPMQTLAKLRRIPDEEAEEREIMRFLKLTRRQHIRQANAEKGTN
jgi:hypothetical protein